VIPLDKIQDAKHIVIMTDSKRFFNGSALYTYLLQLKKKVSIYAEDDIDIQLSFLPWFDKVRNNIPSSADLSIELKEESLFPFFKLHGIVPNKKMCTSLCAGYIKESQKISNLSLDGTFFANLSELIQLGANYQECVENLYYKEPLSLYRLKAKMFENMLLLNNATVALFRYDPELLKATGSKQEDLFVVMREALCIVHVKQAVLLDQNNELIKIIKLEDK
jgi:hypothetical protein